MPQQGKIILGLVVRTSFEGRTIETPLTPTVHYCVVHWTLDNFYKIIRNMSILNIYTRKGRKSVQFVAVGVRGVGCDV